MINRTISIVFFISLFIVSSAFATIWTVNNNPGDSNADFTSLQEAHDGASEGDTLYVYGSGIYYGSLTMTKTLYIYGPGYYQGYNSNTRANTAEARTSTITFEDGSEGTLFSGMDVNDMVNINTSNITFKRNHVQFSLQDGYIVSFGDSISNILFCQNFVRNTYNSTYYNDEFPNVLRINTYCTNIKLMNNYIGTEGEDGGEVEDYAIYISTTSEGNYILHNVLKGNLRIRNGVFKNNILRKGDFNHGNVDYQYNISSSDVFGTENGNQANVDMNTVFINSESSDGQFQLAEGSPAIDAGENGVDIGMFGGMTPYVLSGIVPLPTVYYFNAPSVVGHQSELNVNMKIRSSE